MERKSGLILEEPNKISGFVVESFKNFALKTVVRYYLTSDSEYQRNILVPIELIVNSPTITDIFCI